MDRRDFIRFVAILFGTFVLPNCLDSKEVQEAKRLLDNADLPGFYIRFIKPIEPVDPSKWSLKVGGQCRNPQSFTLSEIQKLPKSSQTSRLNCVESWSSKAKWGGFRADALFDIVRPIHQARFLYLYCADDYYEFIPIDEIKGSRVLFVYEMNDKPLPDIHGGPLRLIVPAKYGYKSVKTIMKIDFVEKAGQGYWVKQGYDEEATIQPGTDHALDLGVYKKIENPGEQSY